MERDVVYELINGERYYQDSLGPDRKEPTIRPHDVGSYLTMMRAYMTKADTAWVANPGDTAALDVVRKIAGICVHCMEDHGAPARLLKG